MTRSPGPRRDRHRTSRLVLALLASLVVLVAGACSDAPTEKEIAMADDGIDPSIVPIFTSENLLPAVQQLGQVFLIDHPGTTFQYIAKDAETLGRRVSDGIRPALWIDEARALDPHEAQAIGEPAPVGDDVVQFVRYRDYKGPAPTLEVFGAGSFPARSALCDVEVPCGRAARAILDDAGITPEPDAMLPTGRDVVAAAAKGEVDTSLLYRSDTARLWTAFKLLPLPDPTIGARTYQSLRMRDDTIANGFQTWIATSPDADAVLVKLGLRPRPELERS